MMGPWLRRKPSSVAKRAVQLFPNAIVRPEGQIFVRGALQVEPGDRTATHAQKGEAAIVAGIDQLVRCRLGLRENAEPAERVDLLIDA